jgi:hypothetical protein
MTFTTRRTNKADAKIAVYGFTLSNNETRTGFATEEYAAEAAREMIASRLASPIDTGDTMGAGFQYS